mgnify:FL=1|jgi:hypothetical protein
MTPKGWRKEEWENLKKDYPNNYMKVYEIKDRINAYVNETWRCLIDQEASMKQVDLKSMFEQIFKDGKQLGKEEKI